MPSCNLKTFFHLYGWLLVFAAGWFTRNLQGGGFISFFYSWELLLTILILEVGKQHEPYFTNITIAFSSTAIYLYHLVQNHLISGI